MITISKSERIHQRLLFFLFGIGLMAIAPRTPDMKANLGVNNGTMGTLLSFGAIGAVISLLAAGQLVHRFGPKRVLIVASTVLYTDMALQPHIQSPLIFVVAMIAASGCFGVYHTSINAQALHRQTLSGESFLPRMHGTWSAGALFTAILGAFLAGRVSLAWHIDILMPIIWVLTQISIHKLTDVFVDGKDSSPDETPSVGVATLKIFIKEGYLFIIAATLAIFLEACSNDWSSLMTKEDMGASESSATLSYIAFMFAMILGRLNAHRLTKIRPERYWFKLGCLLSGIGFLSLSQSAKYLAPHHRGLAIALAVLAFFIGGLGSSILAPILTTILNTKSSLSGGVIVAQLAMLNTIAFFVLKVAMAWIAQATSITLAMAIPAIFLVILSRMSKLVSDTRTS